MQKYKILIDERTFEGTPVEIMEEFQKDRFSNDVITLEEFLIEVQQNVWRLFGIGISVDKEDTLENRCTSLVDQLIELGMIRLP